MIIYAGTAYDTSSPTPCQMERSLYHMSSSGLFEDDRQALARACLDPKRRFVGHPPNRPSRWHPYTVDVPELSEFNMPYTDPSAFEFCGQQLKAGHPIERIALDTPL